MGIERHLKVFKNGRNRAIRIPVEFEFPGDEVIMRKEGDKITIEPVEGAGSDFFHWLSKQEPLDEDFPDVDEGLLPLRDVKL
ncbi:antitoxin [Rhizobium sp. L1K21]|uniref:antitoxin n=1 Tax=Rhizobium sp. L1K21 TaxID=2954933 RepID=UPI0020935EEE|nr:AbrB/MazE/SpoVT family DNA-binding domain-containing protein [Rhizobium sp. L1K21]MCO6186568.1 AbrB/MazE/SpoVT family DNA-binding domain-containing protein [Rhizobium sp. L1K21]